MWKPKALGIVAAGARAELPAVQRYVIARVEELAQSTCTPEA